LGEIAMQTEKIDLSTLPEQAQMELYDFYLFLKQRYAHEELVQEQKKVRRIKRLNDLKVDSFTPLSRQEIYE